MRRLGAACLLAILPAGCMTGPLQDNPTYVPGDAPAAPCENPVLLYPNRPPGEAYAELFDRVLDAVDDYFPIAYANRYEGRVLGRATIAPGTSGRGSRGPLTNTSGPWPPCRPTGTGARCASGRRTRPGTSSW